MTLLASVASGQSLGSPPEPADLHRYVVVDNVCAWPNLVPLNDGTIAAIIHNRPSHGTMEGDVDCWVSQDGAFWKKRGQPAPNDPGTIRMNVAAGRAKNGDLIVLCSAWTNQQQPGQIKQAPFRDAELPPWVCRSSDGGRTWSQRKEFPASPEGWTVFVPFGPIVIGADGALHASCYARGEKIRSERHAWHLRSDDDGRTWRKTSLIGAVHSEISLLHLGGKKWLAAARNNPHSLVEVLRSDDDGETWHGAQRVTETRELNAHLLRLQDGRLLLSYGNRREGEYGVLAKFSRDEGATWGSPVRIMHSLEGDCGYPSSVQRADGKIVTAYYTKAAVNHERYHMGVAIWSLE